VPDAGQAGIACPRYWVAKSLIPDRKEDRKIAAVAVLAAAREVERMVPAMVTRADQQQFAKAPEGKPGIDMRQVLDRLDDDQQADEMSRRYADRAARRRQTRSRQCRSSRRWLRLSVHKRHLALTVVDRVQRPPPAKTVRQAVAPVFGEVQDQEIDQETEQWPRLQRRKPGLRVVAG
jgi:hypothetical protein